MPRAPAGGGGAAAGRPSGDPGRARAVGKSVRSGGRYLDPPPHPHFSPRLIAWCADGRTDDAAALQRGIDAAQAAARTLFLPAGRYVVNATLLVRPFRHDVRNSPFKPLRLLGEGEYASTIVAGKALDTVIDILPCTNPAHSSSGHSIEQLTVDAADSALPGGAPTGLGGTPLANFSIRALGTTRTWLTRVHATGAATAAVFLSHGWCNRILSCRFSNNAGSGLQLVAALNNVEIADSLVEQNGAGADGNGHAPGVIIDRGIQVALRGNTIEGNLVSPTDPALFLSPLPNLHVPEGGTFARRARASSRTLCWAWPWTATTSSRTTSTRCSCTATAGRRASRSARTSC